MSASEGHHGIRRLRTLLTEASHWLPVEAVEDRKGLRPTMTIGDGIINRQLFIYYSCIRIKGVIGNDGIIFSYSRLQVGFRSNRKRTESQCSMDIGHNITW